MKIGDLVQLSAAGRKLHQNDIAVGGWGIITSIEPDYFGNKYPIKTKWFCKPQLLAGAPIKKVEQVCFSRYEIKKLKSVKK